jgi:tetraacyldisaccharide 4'-kinase
MNNLLKYFLWVALFPLSLLYALIMACRNLLFDLGLKSVYVSPIQTINIGNLTVGGTGKTPHVEYLIRLFRDKYTLATLSRGYGRSTTGFMAANDRSTADSIGDEPFQLFQKFDVPVFVSEKRAIGLQQIEQIEPKINLILLDDAFQHRAISPTTNILLTDYNRLFVNDLVLPSGRLREWRTGAKRADCVVVSKCPDILSGQEQGQITRQIRQYTKPETPIFFSSIRYATPLPYFLNQPAFDTQKSVILLSGIAQPARFEQDARQHFAVAQHLIFRDHHHFTKQDLAAIKSKIVLTTEKDVAKIKPLLNVADSQFYFWPIEIVFLKNNGVSFDEWIVNIIKTASAQKAECS